MLYLLRHAKAAASTYGDQDRDRPLTPSGYLSAAAIGDEFVSRGIVPDLALCSVARRAVETWQALVARLNVPPPAQIEGGLYSCGAQGLLSRLQQVESVVTSVLLLAHNPDIQELAFLLTGQGLESDSVGLPHHFPAGALAAIEADAITWPELGSGRARLVFYLPPK